ncbi:MFS transporter [Streptomyces sp. NPDC088730]|uniref:MFS transporter n=1 Tax=Streptomyces sp. NPDC088730 TaxID=3365877 RepID=UPI003817BE57
MIAVTFRLLPCGGHTMGWTDPLTDGLIAGGLILLAAFVVIENRVSAPMIELSLFRLRALTFGTLAGLAVSIGRGGMRFVLIIWPQGIWLPLHGYDYSDTPLWAGIFMLPLTAGCLAAGPVSGYLSDRIGSRGLATGGALLLGAGFLGLMFLPIDFSYWIFAVLITLNGIAGGMFAAPDSSSIMGSAPARLRGVASGMRATFQNSGTAVHRRVLLPHDRRTGRQPPAHADRRTATTGRPGTRRRPGRQPAPGLVALRRPAGCQPPSWVSTRSSTCSSPPAPSRTSRPRSNWP